MKASRVELLEEGIRLTKGSRNEAYGEPIDNLNNIARLWSAYIGNKLGHYICITPEDVAWLNTLQKIARTQLPDTKTQEDTYVDAAVYAAIAGEVTIKDTPPK